jgi:RHS repeat-associated protein
MSRFLRYLFLMPIFWAAQLFGQGNIPSGVTGPVGATARKLPAVYSSQPVNYIRTYSPVKSITDTGQINLNSLVGDVGISTLYADSYGRRLQTVIKQASPAKNDCVTPEFYDEFGNASIQYLPFVSQLGNNNDGKFKLNPFNQDSTFYKTSFPNEQINYGQGLYDGSPMNIPIKTISPGNSWGGVGVGVSYTHRTNSASDTVRLWTINISSEDDVPSTASTYQAGTLTVFQTTDEKGNLSVKYVDVIGRIILTKIQNSAVPSSGHSGWLCTYYVYDEMNHVRLVITPKAVEALNNPSVNWNLASNPTINTGLCYGYYYDNRGRTIMKRIPGKSKLYKAYDLFDRVVMTQDSSLRVSNQWAFSLYDGQSRLCKTGLITMTIIKDSVLSQASRSTSYPTLTGTYTINTETYYDDYTWIPSSGTSLTNTLVTTNINSINFNTSYNTSPDYAQQITQSNRIRGAITGTKKIIINSSTYLYSVNIYDDHRRSIQTSQINYTGGTDVATLQYGFSGRILRSHLAHQKSGTNPQTHSLLTKYSYDHIGRPLSVSKNLDNSTDKTIGLYTYNEFGQLSTKVFGNSIETQNYSYNIRGWLLGINTPYLVTSGSTSNYFGEALFYDYGFTTNQLNGNIAGAEWKAYGDGIARAYGFDYDKTNKLTTADFSQQNQGSSSWTSDKVDYSLSGLSYDGNGNILSLKQRGLKIGSSVTIDSLTYQYFANSNQLQKVSDAIADMSPLGDFKDSTQIGDDYTYDANGNTNKDYNRHMCTSASAPGAVFNFLNMPDSIVINGKAGIHYYYDAAGNQLRKQINDYATGANPAIKNYLYISGFVYMNDTLQYNLQEEGKIRYAKKVNSTTGAIYYAYEYDYFLKDHLGNVRTVLTEGRDTATYAATMETKDSAVVTALFSNVYSPIRTVFAKPTAFDTDTSNHYVARLNASSGINIKVGPSLVLKVMAGDQVQVSTYSYYTTPVQPPVSGVNLLTDILTLLGQAIVNNSGGKLASGDITNVNNVLNPNVVNFLNNGRSYDSTKPKAYLNWILFDNQFNYVASNSGVQQVQPGSSKQVLSIPLQTINKNGYLYVYVSNESGQDVFFDNLTIKQFTGPLEQEQSYYPFGLQMAGISDKALLKQNNPYKFNSGVELEEDYGVNYYNTSLRKYDPQIGRFTGLDAMSESTIGLSPYHFSNNNPISLNDPTGAKFAKPWLPQTAQMADSWFDGSFADLFSMEGVGRGGGGGAGGSAWFGVSGGPFAAFWNAILSNLWKDPGSTWTTTNNGQGTYQFVHSRSDETITLTGGKIRNFGNMSAMFDVNGVCASGLQAIQVYYGGQELKNGNPAPGNQFTNDGSSYCGFVDGGPNSPWVTDLHEAPPGGDKPYYISSTDDGNGASVWDENNQSGGLTISDFAFAVNLTTFTRFEVYIIAVNYEYSGQDKILGSFTWGYNDAGMESMSGTNINFNPGPNISAIAQRIISFDYPNYKFYGK